MSFYNNDNYDNDHNDYYYKDGAYDADEEIVLPLGTTRPTVPGRVQLVVRNNDKAPIEENIQKVMLELIGEEKSRLGLDLVVVLDSSYRIREEKLHELKMAMLFMMKKLSFVDRLSIVKYSYKAEMIFPLRQITKSSQTELEDLITACVEKIQSDLEVHVNIADGLETALTILKNRSVSSGRVGVIMLMLGSRETIGNVAAIPLGNVAVHTFGFGKVHDPKVLKAIANNSRLGGTYSDVRVGNLSLAFSQCLAGLLSVVAQDLTVTVSQIDSTIKQVSTGSYPQSRDNASGSIIITFGNIYIQEIRKVLVNILLPVTKKEDETVVLKVSYTYRFDGELYDASPQTVIVHRKSGLRAEEQQELPDVRAEEVSLIISELIKQATADADEEDFKSAQDKLANGLLELEDGDIEKLKAKLRPELEELLKLMKMTQAIYKRQALPFAYSLLISLATQRQTARGNNIGQFQLFATPTMQEFLEEAKKLHDIDDNKQYNNDPDASVPKPFMPGKVQLVIRNNNKAPLETNIQKVLLELSGVENNEFGLDLVAVLDVSSSMEGDKFAKMKMAMQLLIKNLSYMDRLSIVEYSKKAKRLCPLSQMTESSQTKLENLIDDLKLQPGTNITDGLEMALNVLEDHLDSSGRVGVIILMSDGKQNQGGDAADVQVSNVPVLTFGFGEDHNPEVLIAIANNSQMGGTYVEVCMDDLNLTFPHCLAELQSVVVWDLTVTVTPIKNESTVKQVSAGRYLKSIDNAAGSVTITLGTLYIQEVHKVLVDILLPVTNNENEADILKVSYKYRSSFDEELCEAEPATVTVHRMSNLTGEEQRPQIEVTDTEVHLLIAEVIKQATGVVDKENVKSVRDKLVDSLKTVEDVDIGSICDTKCSLGFQLKGLKNELEQLSKMMQSEAINEKHGHSFAYSLLISHFTQRGSARGNYELFAIPAMREFLEEAKKYDEIDDLHIYIDRFICAVKSIEMIISQISMSLPLPFTGISCHSNGA